MSSSAPNLIKAAAFILVGLGFAAGGFYVGETDDSPGAALLGLILMIVLVVLGVRAARRKS